MHWSNKSLSAAEVAAELRKFVDGESGGWGWDDFISMPLADSKLDALRKRAAAVRLPAGEREVEELIELIREAENLAKAQKR